MTEPDALELLPGAGERGPPAQRRRDRRRGRHQPALRRARPARRGRLEAIHAAPARRLAGGRAPTSTRSITARTTRDVRLPQARARAARRGRARASAPRRRTTVMIGDADTRRRGRPALRRAHDPPHARSVDLRRLSRSRPRGRCGPYPGAMSVISVGRRGAHDRRGRRPALGRRRDRLSRLAALAFAARCRAPSDGSAPGGPAQDRRCSSRRTTRRPVIEALRGVSPAQDSPADRRRVIVSPTTAPTRPPQTRRAAGATSGSAHDDSAARVRPSAWALGAPVERALRTTEAVAMVDADCVAVAQPPVDARCALRGGRPRRSGRLRRRQPRGLAVGGAALGRFALMHRVRPRGRAGLGLSAGFSAPAWRSAPTCCARTLAQLLHHRGRRVPPRAGQGGHSRRVPRRRERDLADADDLRRCARASSCAGRAGTRA